MNLGYCGRTVLAGCVVASLLGGRAADALTLYSETRDKQGQDIKKSWGDVEADIASHLSVPRKNIKTLLDEQLAVEEEIWAVHRSARAREMAHDWTLQKFRDTLTTRVRLLTPVPADELKAYRIRLEKAQESFNTVSTNFAGVGHPAPSCPALLTKDGFDNAVRAATKLKPPKNVVVVQGLPRAQVDCKTFAELKSVLAGGELGAAKDRLKKEVTAIEDDVDRAQQLKDDYEAKKAAYTAAAEELLGNPSSTEAKTKVTDALKKLQALEDKFKKAQDAFSTEFIAKERLASLDAFLKTYQDVTTGKAVVDGNKIAIALAVFPDIGDKAKKALADVEKPKLVSLAIQKNIELAKLDAAQKDIALRRQVVAELESQVAALDAQVQALNSALDPFADPAVAGMLGKKLVDVMTAKDGGGLVARTKLWKATTRYLDAEGRLRAEVGKSEYRISALSHERALTYAESNITQWKALIDPSVDLMAAYGAAGLKTSDLIALFNSLTLLWIGAGVH